jgi:hypothetical protein
MGFLSWMENKAEQGIQAVDHTVDNTINYVQSVREDPDVQAQIKDAEQAPLFGGLVKAGEGGFDTMRGDWDMLHGRKDAGKEQAIGEMEAISGGGQALHDFIGVMGELKGGGGGGGGEGPARAPQPTAPGPQYGGQPYYTTRPMENPEVYQNPYNGRVSVEPPMVQQEGQQYGGGGGGEVYQNPYNGRQTQEPPMVYSNPYARQ